MMYMYTHTQFLYSFTCDGVGYLQYLVIKNKKQVIEWTYAFSPLRKYLGVEWLGLTAGICLTFKETAKLSSKVVVPFYITTSNILEFQLSHILTNTWYGQSF